MSLVSVPPAPASPTNTVVAGDGWWPDIDCNAMRDALRLGEVVTHARLLGAIEGGLITIEGQLAAWRAGREAEGASNLAEVESDRTINGTPRMVVLWTRAVRFAAGAELAELHRDVSATADGHNSADVQAMTSADYKVLAMQAVRDMLGTPRIDVELI